MTTNCWNCKKSYDISVDRCPHCGVANANFDLEMAQIEAVKNVANSVNKPMTYHERLNHNLNYVATNDQIMNALGIQDEASQEGFWTAMRYAAHLRFYLMCLKKADLPLDTDIDTLDRFLVKELADIAYDYINIPGFSYKVVREWFINGGSFEYKKAMTLKEERIYLETHWIRVLVILEKGAKYLGYGDCGEPILVDFDEAKKYPLHSMTETTKQYLINMADHFKAAKELFNAREVKLLIGGTKMKK